jgi:membrane protein YdbS with pleckstrin-like domain
MLLRKLNRNQDAIAGIVCIGIFLIMVIFMGIMIFFILSNLVSIGIGLLMIVLPIFLMVVIAILAKKYLFEKGGK